MPTFNVRRPDMEVMRFDSAITILAKNTKWYVRLYRALTNPFRYVITGTIKY
jgi:hypothetical protein